MLILTQEKVFCAHRWTKHFLTLIFGTLHSDCANQLHVVHTTKDLTDIS